MRPKRTVRTAEATVEVGEQGESAVREDLPVRRSDRVVRSMRKYATWTTLVVGVLTLPYIEPLFWSLVCAFFPPFKRIVSVTYPNELLELWGKICAFTITDLSHWWAALWHRVVTAGVPTTAMFIAGLALAGYCVFGRYLPTIVRVRRFSTALYYTFALAGLFIWIGFGVNILGEIFGANIRAATSLLPSFSTMDTAVTRVNHLIDEWIKIDVTYFGWKTDIFDFILHLQAMFLQLELWLLAIGSIFSAASLLDRRCTWRGLLKKQALESGNEDEEEDDE